MAESVFGWRSQTRCDTASKQCMMAEYCLIKLKFDGYTKFIKISLCGDKIWPGWFFLTLIWTKLTDITRFGAEIFWCLIKFMMPSGFTRATKQTKGINYSTPYFTMFMEVLHPDSVASQYDHVSWRMLIMCHGMFSWQISSVFGGFFTWWWMTNGFHMCPIS